MKDLAKGVISIKDQPLNIKRCSKSGLLVINLTEGLTNINNTPPNELPQIPKCHRKYNIAYTASTSEVAMADHDMCGFHSRDYDILQTKLNEELRSDRKVIIMTRGRRFQQHACRTSRNTLSINCEDIYDPDQDVNLRSHVGWHHGILETLSKVERFIQHLNNILEFVTQQEAGSKVLVDLECKSGRHRSVGQGFAAFRCLKVLGYDVVLIHASSWKWGEMRCGGVCHGCQDMAASLGQIRHLIPNMSRLARSRGSVSSGRDVRDAPADDAPGEHSSHPTSDHPTAGHPTSDQLDEIRRLVQGLATDVGHLRTEQVEIKRMAETGRRSRSPLRRRRLPTPPSPPRRRRSPSFSRKKLPPWRHAQASRGRSLGRDRSPTSRPAPSRPISSRPAPRSPDHPPPHISDVLTDPEGPMTDPDQRCHNDLESLPMIAMSLSDWSETIWHQMDRSTTRTCQWQHWTVSSLAKLCLFASVRVTGIGSFGFAKMAKIHWWKEFEWTSWFEIISGPIGLSRSRMASSTGSDLRGADLAMEATGNSLKTTLTAKAMVRLDNSWIDVIVFHHPPGVFDDSGREHTWAFVSSWPPTRNCGI